MPRTIALLFASTLLFTTSACDSTDEPVEDRAAEAQPGEVGDPGEVGAKRDHHGKHDPGERLCTVIECSEAQAAQIDELFAERHEQRDGSHEDKKADRAAAHKAIADAFRADSFDVAVLDRIAPEHDGEDREAQLVAFATELHALLTPEQRAKLADEIESGRPLLFHHGKRGKHGKWGKKHGKEFDKKQEGDHEDRLAHAVDRFCEPIRCTAEQSAQLTATFQGVHEAKRDARAEHHADKPDLKPLADAFRAETLDQDQLRAALPDKHERKADHLEHMGATLAEIHTILTPEQRAIVADTIEAEGLHAVIGKGKRHGKRGKGKHRGPEAVDAE